MGISEEPNLYGQITSAKMTPDEAAKLGLDNIPEVIKWLMNASAIDIIEFHHLSRYPKLCEYATIALHFRLGKQANDAADKLMTYTKLLTWLTVILAVFSVWQMFPAIREGVLQVIQWLK